MSLKLKKICVCILNFLITTVIGFVPCAPFGWARAPNEYILTRDIIPDSVIMGAWDFTRATWDRKPEQSAIDDWKAWDGDDFGRPLQQLLAAQVIWDIRQSDRTAAAITVLTEADSRLKDASITEPIKQSLLGLAKIARRKVENTVLKEEPQSAPHERPLREPSIPRREKKRKEERTAGLIGALLKVRTAVADFTNNPTSGNLQKLLNQLKQHEEFEE